MAYIKFTIDWYDYGREPRVEANPRYPNGVDVKLILPTKYKCRTKLPYPARRCGYYIVTCKTCGAKALCTTAGRRDDPKSIEIACGRNFHGAPQNF